MKTSFDSFVALIRELSVEEQEALVDSDNRPALKQFLVKLQFLLTPVGTIKVLPTEKFSASDFFKVNTAKNASVKTSHLGDNFKAWFLGKTKERTSASEAVPGDGPYRTPGATEVALRYYTLNKRSVDGPIIAQLGGVAKAETETSLAEIAACLQKQASGEPGMLLTNGYANIFYVRDSVWALRAVNVDWYGDGWSVYADSVEHPNDWSAGSRVFSRDS